MIAVKWRGPCPECGEEIIMIPLKGSIECSAVGPLVWCGACKKVAELPNPFKREVEV